MASALAKDVASVALTPNSALWRNLVSTSAATTPMPAPIAPSRRPRARNPRTTAKRRRAERHANADFVRALLDRVGHEPVGAQRGERHAGDAEDEEHRRREVEQNQRAGDVLGQRLGGQDRAGRASSAATCARACSTSASSTRRAESPRVCRIIDRPVDLQERQIDVRARWLR